MAIDKIVCIGKNYLEHAKELGDAVPEKPVLFLKPASVMKQAKAWGETILAVFPEDDNVQPECEIVLRLKKGGYKLNIAEATNAIDAVTLGLDMTLRSRQAGLKKAGHPWTTAKVFPDAAIIGPWVDLVAFSNYLDEPFSMTLDGAVSQQDKGTSMMMSPHELIAYASQFFPLCEGDVIFTGTPAGVKNIKQDTIAKLQWRNHFFCVKWI